MSFSRLALGSAAILLSITACAPWANNPTQPGFVTVQASLGTPEVSATNAIVVWGEVPKQCT